ncbi:MAG: hypothetical protein NC253_11115 [Ruminococcus sp.]|nr:hypothetical protein [Ruminococcus sp.]MCM1380303.1 hypothetical protein [Muribaculaceae bacterium]MCM1478283.1 hypothetical protein [Muribaculaceae bacterium]
MKKLNVKLTFIEDVLGTASSNPELHEEFIASKSPDAKTIEEEVAAVGVEEVVEKAMTIFPRTADGKPFVYDYQIRGFFKEACSCLKKVPDTLSSKIKAYKKQIDGLVFVGPRQIPFDLKGMRIDNCQRPLRGSTPQGERISLANSEVVPAGSTIEFTVLCLVDGDIDWVKEMLEYGVYKGLGQWRNSGKGRFEVEYLD